MSQSFDLIGWAESTPGTGTVRIAAGLNDYIRHNADLDGIILLPRHSWMLGLFATAVATGEEARLHQPEMQIDQQYIKVNLLADNDPTQGWQHHFGDPMPLTHSTSLWAESVNAGDEGTLIGALVGDARIRRSILDALTPTHKIHGVADTTLTANTWTQCPVTWDHVPPKGKYGVIGMRGSVWHTTTPGQALMRLLMPGHTDHRPGVPCGVSEADHEEFQSVTHEPWVKWPITSHHTFVDTQMPDVECLSQLADTDENVELLIKYLGPPDM